MTWIEIVLFGFLTLTTAQEFIVPDFVELDSTVSGGDSICSETLKNGLQTMFIKHDAWHNAIDSVSLCGLCSRIVSVAFLLSNDEAFSSDWEQSMRQRVCLGYIGHALKDCESITEAVVSTQSSFFQGSSSIIPEAERKTSLDFAASVEFKSRNLCAKMKCCHIGPKVKGGIPMQWPKIIDTKITVNATNTTNSSSASSESKAHHVFENRNVTDLSSIMAYVEMELSPSKQANLSPNKQQEKTMLDRISAEHDRVLIREIQKLVTNQQSTLQSTAKQVIARQQVLDAAVKAGTIHCFPEQLLALCPVCPLCNCTNSTNATSHGTSSASSTTSTSAKVTPVQFRQRGLDVPFLSSGTRHESSPHSNSLQPLASDPQSMRPPLPPGYRWKYKVVVDG